jgi:hypothetical protein
MLIAYGLLSPRAAAFNGADPYARPMAVSDRLMLPDDMDAIRYAYANGYRPQQTNDTVSYAPRMETVSMPVRAVQTAAVAPAPQRVVTRTVERAPKRDWKKTALVIGGSTATGAGVGGIIGGKKGALIGAAIGGGASTLYEVAK